MIDPVRRNKRVKKRYTNVSKECSDILIHLPMLVLRKSVGQLMELQSLCPTKNMLSTEIINVKYEISKCRMEVVNIISAMANDYTRFEIDSMYPLIYRVHDTKTKTHFTMHNWSSSYETILPEISINGEKFLTNDETKILASVIISLHTISRNEFKIKQEQRKIGVQESVFGIYGNNK